MVSILSVFLSFTLVLLLLNFPHVLCGNSKSGWVTIKNSTYAYTGYNITLYSNETLNTFNTSQFQNYTLNTYIVETPYLKITLIPEYGARILSIIYKPTGTEQLYQNPIVVPFCWGCGNFYYDWLQVIGGIHPTFVEPEHGKFWNLPWNFSVLEQLTDKIILQFSMIDHVYYDTPPSKFVYGMTNLTAVVNVIIYGNSSYVEYETNITNPQNWNVNYEFWVCETVTPGSKPGNTFSPLNSEIVAAGVTQVKVQDGTWPWMATIDTPIDPVNHIYEFNNLKWFKNWQDEGIAYANMTLPWSGVINQENQNGFFRYSTNPTIFPGLKMWTWGNESINTDPTKDLSGSRPYIELWGGHSREFFTPATLSPLTTKKSTFFYLPTIGLQFITSLNSYGAVELTSSIGTYQVDLQAKIFSTFPNTNFQIVLGWIDLNNKLSILYKTIYESMAQYPSMFVTTQPIIGLEKGNYLFTFYLQNLNGVNLLTGNITVSLS